MTAAAPTELAGRGFVVTGGTRGLGRALVLAATARGAQVVFCGRPGSEDAAREVCDAAGPSAGEAWFAPADVSREEDVEALFDFAMEKLDALHVLVNNAALLKTELLIQTSLADWNEVMGVNLRGAFLATRRAIEEFLAGGEGGRIVNVASVMAAGGAGLASYAASKAALLSFTRAVAKEYGRRDIACNAVVPGFLEGGMSDGASDEARRERERLSPQRRLGRVAEVVEAILYLASGEASYVTGDALWVAGALRDVPELRS